MDTANGVRRFNSALLGTALAITAATLVVSFRHWEPGRETWGYWWFARLFAETHRFPILDKAPLYVVYLNAFRWLEFPHSLDVETIVTLSVLIASLVFCLMPYLGISLATFTGVVWLPFLESAEPPPQKLAFACVCVALGLRERGGKNTYAYALLVAAILFRSTYGVYLLLFAFHDIVRMRRQWRAVVSGVRLRVADWPLVTVLAFFACVLVAQSPHRWNNVWFGTTTYFPSEGKSFVSGTFIQNYNMIYNVTKTGSYEGPDFYFTNREVFAGATNALEAVRANPTFILAAFTRNVRTTAMIVGFELTQLYRIRPAIPWQRLVVGVVLLCVVIFGAFLGAPGIDAKLMVWGSLVQVLLVTVSLPGARYMIPMAFVLALAARGVVNSMWSGVETVMKQTRTRRRLGAMWLTAALILCLSDGVRGWSDTVTGLADDVGHGNMRLLERRRPEQSMKAGFRTLESVLKGCQGVMALEGTFIGGFVDLPLQNVYDIWEIPPFGQLGDRAYDGLRPARIDCIAVSEELTTVIGSGTNSKVRYDNYIRPYINELASQGAETVRVEGFGEVVRARVTPNR